MIRIWAHRGCSFRYPENTLTAFRAALELPGLTGIETDVQLTKDGVPVIIHDEKVDRTTDGKGWVKDFTLAELQALTVQTKPGDPPERIPTLEELLDLLEPYLKDGLYLNLELKNSKILYPGMEQKVVEMLKKYEVCSQIVFSSFYARSLSRVRELMPGADIGMLDIKASDCLYKLRGGCGANAIHPYAKAMDVDPLELRGMVVRGWLREKLYPAPALEEEFSLEDLEKSGVTDVFMNEPERFLR